MANTKSILGFLLSVSVISSIWSSTALMEEQRSHRAVLEGDIDPNHPQLGKIYDETEILGMRVEGFKLDMTQKETEEVLKKDGWQGSWHPFEGSTSDFPFTRGKETVYLLRYKNADGENHIWSIVYNRKLDKSEDFLEWSKDVATHYGVPTIKHTNIEYSSFVYYFCNETAGDPKLEADINKYSITFSLSDQLLVK